MLHAAQAHSIIIMERGHGWFRCILTLILITLLGCIITLNCTGRALAQASSSSAGVDCLHQTCGSVNVSYPFRLSSNAHCPSFSSFFDLDCNVSGQLADLYLPNVMSYNNVSVSRRVLHIDFDSIIIDATGLHTPLITSPNGTCTSSTASAGFSDLLLPPFPSPFFFSDDNRFASFGCSIVGIILGAEILQNTSTSEGYDVSTIQIGGCYVLCPGEGELNPMCEGRTCCVSDVISNGTSFREVVYGVSLFSNDINDTSPCNTKYSTLFHPNYTDFTRETYGVKLNWALPSNHTQSIAEIQQSPKFACSNNSNITILQQVPGYYCSCQDGFYGDGYAQGHGCADIDECTNASLNHCLPHKSTCHNIEGGYRCKCNSKYHVGDGLRSGSGCSFSPTLRKVIAIICAIVVAVLVIGGVVIFALWWNRRVKRKYFLQNGGVQLQDIIAKVGGKRKSRLFTAEELKAATENYAEHMKLGIGGFGTVYKGILADGQLVAIKKAHLGAGGNEEFLNELQILLHINHRNIVRLLGCCMEIAVPLLVYEYVSHGTVRQNLDANGAGVVGWRQRLKVAKQTAEALAYLHAAASPPILHRDVKSANVLLDGNLDAKVADFGASRLVPEGMQHVSTAVQGTVGYLDPEYFQTLQLTDKSDVYSLGVMLVELISGQKPIDKTREPCFTSLSVLFIACMGQEKGKELIDPCLVEPSNISSDKVQSSIMAVAALALRCLSIQGADRPSMSTLADELRGIAHALEDSKHGKVENKDSPRMSSKEIFSQQMEAGTSVVHKDADVFVQSISSIPSISNLSIPTIPR